MYQLYLSKLHFPPFRMLSLGGSSVFSAPSLRPSLIISLTLILDIIFFAPSSLLPRARCRSIYNVIMKIYLFYFLLLLRIFSLRISSSPILYSLKVYFQPHLKHFCISWTYSLHFFLSTHNFFFFFFFFSCITFKICFSRSVLSRDHIPTHIYTHGTFSFSHLNIYIHTQKGQPTMQATHA